LTARAAARSVGVPRLKETIEMYARVARWEGATSEAIRETVTSINSQAQSGPPEGVPAKGFLMLIDPDGGRTLAITLFENEDDYRRGDETLNAMSPPGEGFGQRAAVERWEVGVDLRV
jgi:uncharacterized protein YcgI (DUF1989 family)